MLISLLFVIKLLLSLLLLLLLLLCLCLLLCYCYCSIKQGLVPGPKSCDKTLVIRVLLTVKTTRLSERT